MTFIKYILFVVLLITITFNSFAQQNQMYGNLTRVPQAHYLNPATSPDFKWYIGMPALSALQIGVSNNLFNLNKVLNNTSSDSLQIDYTRFVDNLRKKNYLEFKLQEEILAFGFKLKKHYFTFSLSEKAHLNFNYPKDLIAFVFKGNGSPEYLGQTADFSGLGVNMSNYHELAIGYSTELTNTIRVGGKLKMLMGVANIQSKKTDLTLYTAPESELHDLTINSSLLINANLPGEVFGNDSTGIKTNDFFSSTKNIGVGVDLGIQYKLNDKITVGFSALDLGFIRWKSSPYTIKYTSDNAAFKFSGFEIKDVFGEGENNFAQDLLDSIQNIFEVSTSESDGYTSFLATNLVASGIYKPTKNDIIGATLMGEFGFKSIHPALSLSYTRKLGKIFQPSICYSFKNRSFTNIGFGFALTLGPFQLYALSDNVLGLMMFNKVYYNDKENSISYPTNSQNLNVRFGINWVFGYLGKVKDKDKGESYTDDYVIRVKKVKKESKQAKVKDDSPDKSSKKDAEISEKKKKKQEVIFQEDKSTKPEKVKKVKVKDDDKKD